MTQILKGTIVSAPQLGALEIHEHGYLILENGILTDILDELPSRYEGALVEDFGDCLITQSFSDLHLHAPQYTMVGLGMDLPLLDWLDRHAFPAESRFSDGDYAREQYQKLARELIRGGTTRVCMFSSLHREATMILMSELEKAGVTGYVGKVNMDRNGGENLRESTEESKRETLLWLEQCGDFSRVKPILTPRFTPSCSDELMEFLGKLAKERDLPIQSHLSENTAELAWVRALHPDCEQYWQTYQKYGLWNDKTAMAHCVWSDEREREAMAQYGVTAVHCADSNFNLCSGVAPIRAMLKQGVRVALGSDIAGGDSLSMFHVIASTIRASKARRIMDQWHTDFLTAAEGWYLGTSAGAEFFGGKAGLALGEPLHALVLDDATLPKLDGAELRFSRAIFRRQEGAIRAVWSEGRRVV
jgi:guanine deaminase